MTYTSGGLIQDVDYNGFASTTVGANVNSVWGTGSTDLGYGQSSTLATVSVGTTVTALQWANLNDRITSIAAHQGTAITSRSNPVATNLIAVQAAINTDLTNVTTNRGNAVASGTTSSTWSGSAAKTTATGSGRSAWTITFTDTVTFASADAARYFFNGGGLIRLDMAKSSTGTDADAEWNALAGRVGTLYLSGRVNGAAQTIAGTSYTGFTRIGGSGTPSPNATTTGWYSLLAGAAATTMFQLNDVSAPYSGNYIRITAAKNAGSTAITFVTTWVSVRTAVIGSTANISGGTNTASPFSTFGTAPAVVCRYIPPSSTYLTIASWGTPTVASSVA